MEKVFWRWLPAIIIMAIIYYISSWPGTTVDSLGLGKESYHINGHFFMFFALGFALFKSTKNILISTIIGILYGVFDEFHQLYVPGRSAGFFDIFVDSIGILLSGLILWKYYQSLPMKLKSWLRK